MTRSRIRLRILSQPSCVVIGGNRRPFSRLQSPDPGFVDRTFRREDGLADPELSKEAPRPLDVPGSIPPGE